MKFETILLGIIALPFLGSLLCAALGRRSHGAVTAFGVGSVALSFAFSVAAFIKLMTIHASGEPRLSLKLYRWFTLILGDSTSIPVDLGLTLDSLSGVMALVVSGIGLLIHIYSAGYMHDDPSYARFFSYLNLFTGAMLILILGSSIPLMFVGWEGVGLASYLLIGFWFENPAYAAAGRKAFVVNRIGDFGVILGMLLLASQAHSFEFTEINAAGGKLTQAFTLGEATLGVSVATVACLLLFLGCAGKSAQLPLYVWLPDAMAGPTPVSALIHAATMVTAGVYLICRLAPVFSLSPTALNVVAIVGSLTALFAASIALVQNHIKKVLAYSTVSQLGFMFAGVGVGAFGAGFFHVFTHAFFKACLFLAAGSVMHAVHAHGDADLRELGGLRRKLPQTHWPFLVSCLAIAGFPLLSGFFSKDEILAGAMAAAHRQPAVGWFVFGVLVLAATMTAFYMFRLYFLTFAGAYRGHHEPHESPASMTLPVAILGVGAAVVGYLGLPHAFHLPNLWGDWLEPVFGLRALHHGAGAHAAHGVAAAHTSTSESLIVMGVGTLAGLVGIAIAWSRYGSGELVPAAAPSGPLHARLLNAWGIDAFYQKTIVRGTYALARFSAELDQIFVDGLLVRVPVLFSRISGWLLTRLQTGRVQAYSAALVVGLALAMAWTLRPHPSFEVTSDGETAQLSAALGRGYEYRWDFNSDGTFDTPWDGQGASARHGFAPHDYRGYSVRITRGRHLGDETTIALERGDNYVVPTRALRGNWARPRSGELAPSLRVVEDGIEIRPNSAYYASPKKLEDGVARLLPGDHAFVGGTRFEILPRVLVTLQTRNAFGLTASTAKEVTLTRTVRPEERVKDAVRDMLSARTLERGQAVAARIVEN